MTQATTPDFVDDGTEAPAENPIDLEVEDDANLDVDVPSDELDDVDISAEATEGKAAKATSTPRTKAPEGYVKPVEFAKLLSEHLGRAVPPQVVYSYIKNNSGDTAKNPFPVHTVEGDDYAWYIVPQEGLDWWDTKNARVSASKAAKAEKAAKKDAKSDTPAEAQDSSEVAEAE
jgi:hypothetical protein